MRSLLNPRPGVSETLTRLQMEIRAFVACIALALFFATPALSAVTVDDVSQGLTCQCGCGLTVANCNHPECSFSVPMRGEISRMIDKGMDRPAIIAIYRTKFGEKILSAPTTEGFNLLAWVMPFLALLVGGGLIVMMLGRWRHETPSLPEASEGAGPTAATIDPSLREQLDAEVKRQL
jgi:cytochrome c-type biogenesis protein CcmH